MCLRLISGVLLCQFLWKTIFIIKLVERLHNNWPGWPEWGETERNKRGVFYGGVLINDIQCKSALFQLLTSLTWWAGRRPHCIDPGPFWQQVWKQTQQCPCLWSVHDHLQWRWPFQPFQTVRKLLPRARWKQMVKGSSRTELQSVWQIGHAGVSLSLAYHLTLPLLSLQVHGTPARNKFLFYRELFITSKQHFTFFTD